MKDYRRIYKTALQTQWPQFRHPTTTSTSAAVATVEPVFTEPERLALAGFLVG
jgi:hypothetical protein